MAVDEFYEPDEPVDQVIQAFEEGEKGVTGRPTWSSTSYLKLPSRVGQLFSILTNRTNKSTKELPAR